MNSLGEALGNFWGIYNTKWLDMTQQIQHIQEKQPFADNMSVKIKINKSALFYLELLPQQPKGIRFQYL